MDILTTARRLEAALSAQLDRAADRVRTQGPREPLEICHDIVQAVAAHIQPGGRGRYVFPFNRLKLSLAAATKDERARIEAVIESAPTLHDRVIERLTSAGCDVAGLEIKTAFVEAPAANWRQPQFHLELQRVGERPRGTAPRDTPRTVKLVIEHGQAEKASYTFSTPRIDLGRCASLRDDRDRLIRTNHVAFPEGAAEANSTVSRRHAHIVVDDETGHHRVCDDRSAHGTGVLRGGRLINVPSGARGIRLHSGDIILLGEARVRVVMP
jgi:hypothetical protein